MSLTAGRHDPRSPRRDAAYAAHPNASSDTTGTAGATQGRVDQQARTGGHRHDAISPQRTCLGRVDTRRSVQGFLSHVTYPSLVRPDFAGSVSRGRVLRSVSWANNQRVGEPTRVRARALRPPAWGRAGSGTPPPAALSGASRSSNPGPYRKPPSSGRRAALLSRSLRQSCQGRVTYPA